MSWESFGNANKYGINPDGTFKDSRSDPRSENFAGTADERIKSLILRGFGDDAIEYWTVYNYAKQNKTLFINPLSKDPKDLAKRGVTASLMPDVIDFSPPPPPVVLPEVIFKPTERTVIDVILPKEETKPFDDETLERLEKQKEQYNENIKSKVALSSLIPLGIIAFLLINSRNSKK